MVVLLYRDTYCARLMFIVDKIGMQGLVLCVSRILPEPTDWAERKL